MGFVVSTTCCLDTDSSHHSGVRGPSQEDETHSQQSPRAAYSCQVSGTPLWAWPDSPGLSRRYLLSGSAKDKALSPVWDTALTRSRVKQSVL